MQSGAHRLLAVLVAAGITLCGVAGSHAAASVAPPPVVPHHGRAFVPAQGDWEGVAGGFAASFNLSLVRSGASAGYGVSDLVMLRPRSCPANAAQYSESFLAGHDLLRVGHAGGLNGSRLGLRGGVSGARSATLSATYRIGHCHGTLVWHLHPATRTAVTDGSWTAHFSNGESARFGVQSGGRLATGIALPHSLLHCNGLQGALDLFIGRRGGAGSAQDGVTLALRFAGGRASGTLSARGCGGGPLRITARHAGS